MTPVRVAVNAIPLLYPFTGIAQYVRSLMIEVERMPDIECMYFYGRRWERQLRDAPMPGIDRAKSFARAIVPRAYELARMAQQLAFRPVRSLGVDLYHEPAFFPFEGAPVTVTTIHDLSPLRYPETHPGHRVRAMQRLPRALERSAKVIAVSEFVRREVIATYGIAPDKVRTVHNGVAPVYRPRSKEAVQPVLSSLELAYRRYALAVGTLEPRKNLLRVFEAYAPLASPERPLVVVGMHGWKAGSIAAEMRRLEARGAVRFLGFVDEEKLAVLYAGARLLVYPSLYEGFGLPPLEAMASGTPVIVSNRASLPEVTGDAAIQVDPEDVGAIREAMRVLLEDDGRCEVLRAAGLARAATFSWTRCAKDTVDVYREALR